MATKSIAELTLHKLEYGVGAPAVPYDGSTRYVRITDIDDDGYLGADIVSPEYYEEKHVLQDGDILFARTGATVGKTFMYTPSYGKCVYAGFLIRMIPNREQVLPSYVYYFTKSPSYDAFVAQNMKVVAQPNINAKQYASLSFEVPSLQEQAVVVKKLDKIAALISLRKQQIAKLAELVKARFVEMFGDPVLNQRGFPMYTVDDVIEFQGGSQPDKTHFEYEPTPDNIRLIQIRDYKSDKYMTYIPKKLARRFCTADDIMIGRYGPPIFQILKGIEGSFNVALMKATPKMGNREFVRHFLMQDCLLVYLEGLSKRTAGQDGIQMDKLKAYPFPFPPLELQNQFAAFVAQTDQQKLTIQHSLAKLELLKKALMQKYFG